MDAFTAIDAFLHEFRHRLIRARWIEATAWVGVLCVVVSTLAVLATSSSLDPVVIRFLAGSALAIAILAFAGRLWWHTRGKWSDPVHLASIIGGRLPALRDGLRTVVELRPELGSTRPLSFSPALLQAQAERTCDALAGHVPGDLVRYHRVRRILLLLLLVGLTAILLATAYPWGMARGVRTILGMNDASSPSWLAGPVVAVDVLASDIRPTLLFKYVDRVERIPADETGDITAPAGSTIEVSGRFTRPLESAVAVVVIDGVAQDYPVAMEDGTRFRTAFPATRSGQWYLQALSLSGLRLAETVRRPIEVVEVSRPTVHVTPPKRHLLRPGETVILQYEASSSFALAGIDMVLQFPLEPSRVATRTHVRTLAEGTRKASGEFAFTMPTDVAEAGGRIDLSIEAFGRQRQDTANTGESAVLHFFVDHPRFRSMARLEALDTLLDACLHMLAATDAPGMDPTIGLSVDLSSTWTALDVRASNLAEEARQGSPGAPPPDVQTLLDAAGAIRAVDPMNVTVRTVQEVLAATALKLDAASNLERLAQMDARLSEIDREAGRLRTAIVRPANESTRGDLRRVLDRSRRLIRMLHEETRRITAVWQVEGGGARRAATALTLAWTRSRDAVLTSFEHVATAAPEQDYAPTVQAAAEALEQLVMEGRTSLGRLALNRTRTILLPHETATLIRQATQEQRTVMDRTAQAAFVLKTRTDTLTTARASEVGALIERVQEAAAVLGRVATDPLDALDAEDVARLREDLVSGRDLLEERDLDMALKMIRDVTQRAVRLASDLRDQAEWADDTQGAQAAAWRTVSARLSRATPPLREVTRILTLWKRDTDGLTGPVEKAELRALRAAQDGVLELTVRALELFRKAVPGGTAEPVTWLQNARRNMEEAARRLSEFQPSAAEVHQRQAVQELIKLKRIIERGIEVNPARRYAMPEEPESVRIPDAAPLRPLHELVRELESYRKIEPIASYADLVKAYYQALLQSP